MRNKLPSPIFSPLSGGSVKPNTHINEIRIQGKTKLNMK